MPLVTGLGRRLVVVVVVVVIVTRIPIVLLRAIVRQGAFVLVIEVVAIVGLGLSETCVNVT